MSGRLPPIHASGTHRFPATHFSRVLLAVLLPLLLADDTQAAVFRIIAYREFGSAVTVNYGDPAFDPARADISIVGDELERPYVSWSAPGRALFVDIYVTSSTQKRYYVNGDIAQPVHVGNCVGGPHPSTYCERDSGFRLGTPQTVRVRLLTNEEARVEVIPEAGSVSTATATATASRTATATSTRSNTPTASPSSTHTATATRTQTQTATSSRAPIVEDVDVVQVIGLRRTVHSWKKGAPDGQDTLPFSGEQLALLVEGKQTWVRVYVNGRGGTPGTVLATLKGKRGGQTLGSPPAVSALAKPGFVIDRDQPGNSFNVYDFELPSDWTHGVVDAELVLDPPAGPTGRNQFTLNFQRKELRVGWISFATKNSGEQAALDADAQNAGGLLTRIFPARVQYGPFAGAGGPLRRVCVNGSAAGSACESEVDCPGGHCEPGPLSALETVFKTSTPAQQPDVLFGWLPRHLENGNSVCNGSSARFPTRGTITDDQKGDWHGGIRSMVGFHTAVAGCSHHGLVHEIGHLFLIEHPHDAQGTPWGCAGCPKPLSPFVSTQLASPPYIESRLASGFGTRSRTGNRTDYSFMWATTTRGGKTAWSPTDRNDGNVWMPQTIWRWLFDRARGAGQSGSAAGDPFDTFLARGDVFADGSAVLRAGLPSTAPALIGSAGDYCLELLSASKGLLVRHCFPGAGEDPEHDPNPSFGFAETLPRLPGIARLRLLEGERILAQRTAGPNAPVVEISSPDPFDSWEGQNALAWTGSDADGDPLLYMIQYSADDRQSWTTLGVDVEGTTLLIDARNLAGSEKAWLRVVASDGINLGRDEVGPIVVPGKAPAVAIVSPEEGEHISSGTQVLLQASGYDREDGTPEFTWESDRDGDLGRGDVRLVGRLSAGEHLITVAAEDSDGSVGTDAVVIYVHAACFGDCDGDGTVVVAEVVRAVKVALGLQPPAECVAADQDQDGQVTIDELVRSVDAALNGCT